MNRPDRLFTVLNDVYMENKGMLLVLLCYWQESLHEISALLFKNIDHEFWK